MSTDPRCRYSFADPPERRRGRMKLSGSTSAPKAPAWATLLIIALLLFFGSMCGVVGVMATGHWR